MTLDYKKITKSKHFIQIETKSIVLLSFCRNFAPINIRLLFFKWFLLLIGKSFKV